MSRQPHLGGTGRMPTNTYPMQNPPLPPSKGGLRDQRAVQLQVRKVADPTLRNKLVLDNICAVSQRDFPRELQNPKHPEDGSAPFYVLLRCQNPEREFVVVVQSFHDYDAGCISLTEPQRMWCQIALTDVFSGEAYDPFATKSNVYLASVDLDIGFASPGRKTTDVPYDEEELSAEFTRRYHDHFLAPGQRLIMEIRGIPLYITVNTIKLLDLGASTENNTQQTRRESHARGILIDQTQVDFHRDGGRDGNGKFKLKASSTKPSSNPLFTPDFKFEDLGIGGLSKEFGTIFRGVFASRVFPPGLVAQTGITHVKGLLLYGPPGTGKTLIARQIGKLLNAQPPKIINGPEVLNKYVGQSEENIRNLFADAEKEYKEKGDESSLHIIIFDELDAICKQRGSGAGGGTGVGDSVVNQLLSKLDGVDQLNNVLLIGMTNRKDMIDEALMRPGRLEVHVEVSLPDEPGRLEIFQIHTAKLKKNKLLDPDVKLEELAALTKNYSGAEISGVVKSALSFSFERFTEIGQMAAPKQDLTGLTVNRDDFHQALTQVRPLYGVPEEDIGKAIKLGIIPYSQDLNASIEDLMSTVVRAVREDPDLTLSSVLFHGPPGAGKTALAAHLALKSDFPYVKMITPRDLLDHGNEVAQKDYVNKVFNDAYKSPASIIILDEVERLIDWHEMGSTFSKGMLSALRTLTVSEPPKNHRLLVFATTSKLSVLEMLGFGDVFDEQVAVPGISNVHELATILNESEAFNSHETQQVITALQQRTGSNTVSVGIKTIARLIYLARTRSTLDSVESFSDLLYKETYGRRRGNR